MRFVLRFPFVADREQQQNNEALLAGLNQLAQFFSWGDGAPSHTPEGPQVYFEQDGPAVHYFNGAWVELP